MEFSFTNPLFLIPGATGLILFLAGLILRFFPPRKINRIYGYRSMRSMKSKKSWDFAQRRASQELIRFGVLLTLCCILGLYYHPDQQIAVSLGLAFVFVAVIVIIARIEWALRNKFGKS